MTQTSQSQTVDSPLAIPWQCRDRSVLDGPGPLIMGILNVTSDSFSDGGRFLDHEAAVSHGRRLVEEGADILDVGGESTRPGAQTVSIDEERARVLPVINVLSRETSAVISIDTTKATVAREAIDAGARIINDVSALQQDPAMVEVARESGAGVVLMHMQGTPRTMQDNPEYADVTTDVCCFLEQRVRELTEQGLQRECLAVDPGIGFGKTVAHNLELLANLHVLRRCRRPIVVGLSRKRFLGALTTRDVQHRLAGSLAALAFCVMQGVDVMRVHDVQESHDVTTVWRALQQRKEG